MRSIKEILFGKPKEPEEKKKEPEEKKEKKPRRPETFFGGMVEIKEVEGNRLGAFITEYGKKRLDRDDIKEVIDFFRTFDDMHHVSVIYNISGNQVSSSSEYLAYKVLVGACINQITSIYFEDKPEPEETNQLDFLKELRV